MIQRVRNVIKSDNKKARASGISYDVPPSKKEKKDKKQLLLMRYPIKSQQGVLDDPQSVQGHLKALETELKKAKPRESIVLPLMKSTFSSRREWILDTEETIDSALKKYPALSRPAVVSKINNQFF